MVSSHISLSFGAILIAIVVAGAIALVYTQINHSPGSTGPVAAGTAPAERRGKKKKQAGASQSDPNTLSITRLLPPAFPNRTVIPGGFDSASIMTSTEGGPQSKPKKAKKKRNKQTNVTAKSVPPPDMTSEAVYNSDSSMNQSKIVMKRQQEFPSASRIPTTESTVSIDTDGSWTRVESGRRFRGAASTGPSAELSTSDAGIITPVTGNSSPVAERTEESHTHNSQDLVGNRRPLAERLLPKQRQTVVDDMLGTPKPVSSRVMRVRPLPNEKPASGFSWGDYEDVRTTESGRRGNDADRDDGWGVVKSGRGRSKIERRSTVHEQGLSASETLTKRQRQNARKREAQKTSKAEGEAERLATLAKHKRQLEIMEQSSGGGGRA